MNIWLLLISKLNAIKEHQAMIHLQMRLDQDAETLIQTFIAQDREMNEL